MKIERSKLKKGSTEVPAECKDLIEKLKIMDGHELCKHLKTIRAWTFGKCELYHWADILDIFDGILEEGATSISKNLDPDDTKSWTLHVDSPQIGSESVNPVSYIDPRALITTDIEKPNSITELVLHVLHFTSLLIEHSFTRHLYNSVDRLNALLASSNMNVVLAVLHLLYVFSKRSNFITRLSLDKKSDLLVAVLHLAEGWGGRENGFGLADCCTDKPIDTFPMSATTLNYDFYTDGSTKDIKNVKISRAKLDKMTTTPAQLMDILIQQHDVPLNKQMQLFTHVRLANAFSCYEKRLQCVHARLQAISILVYSNVIQENVHLILYNGFIEELVDILELKCDSIMEIKSASLRTLTSIIHLERNHKLENIIDVTGATMYHGFLPKLVRSCVDHLTNPDLVAFPTLFSTSLFSFLYHLASYEHGGDALVSCGMMEALLKIINWYGDDWYGQEHITFVTRAVRVIDLITNLDMQAFQNNGGLQAFIGRLQHEVGICRKEQVYEIGALNLPILKDSENNATTSGPTLSTPKSEGGSGEGAAEGKLTPTEHAVAIAKTKLNPENIMVDGKCLYDLITHKLCFPQRGALLKSMLNFLKKAVPDPTFSDSNRHLMEGSLPNTLKHIISNSNYYGPSLFLLGADVVTVYILQEPSLLSPLQENGLTDVVLQALLLKTVPNTREVLSSLPNMFNALCLNSQGLSSFIACKPFDRLFQLLDELTHMGTNSKNVCVRRHECIKVIASTSTNARIDQSSSTCLTAVSSEISMTPTGDVGSDIDEDSQTNDAGVMQSSGNQSSSMLRHSDRQPVPLIDYTLNVMKFVEAILNTSNTQNHCAEFVQQGGLTSLMRVLALPNLPLDFALSSSCNSIVLVAKAIMVHQTSIMDEAFVHLNQSLNDLEEITTPLVSPGGSHLMNEVAVLIKSNKNNCLDLNMSPRDDTPLLHSLSAVHAYVVLLRDLAKIQTTDIKSQVLDNWGEAAGTHVLRRLTRLYKALVWESTIILSFCNEDKSQDGGVASATNMFGQKALQSISEFVKKEITCPEITNLFDDKEMASQLKLQVHIARVKLLKPILASASCLGHTLSELFALLIRTSSGYASDHLKITGADIESKDQPPAIRLTGIFAQLLANSLAWVPDPRASTPLLRLTFMICSMGFTSLMLFDDSKQCYHLMLQQFMLFDGMTAFFEGFKWVSAMGALSSDQSSSTNFPNASEYLDNWMYLLERLVNTKNIVETPKLETAQSSLISAPEPIGHKNHSTKYYKPERFISNIHKMAFENLSIVWNTKSVTRLSQVSLDAMLNIFQHIIRGENIIQQFKQQKEISELSNKPSSLSETIATMIQSASNDAQSSTSGSSTINPSGGLQIMAQVIENMELAGDRRITAPTPSSEPASISEPEAAVETPAPTSSIGNADVQPSPVEPTLTEGQTDILQKLIEMGFPADMCRRAISATTTLEAATEWLLIPHHPYSVSINAKKWLQWSIFTW